nr:WG repeat-containing protein [uncultured Chitinophaga sp.]
MRKSIVTLSLLCTTVAVCAQDKLYYFPTADTSKVGVKNDQGKIIVPAKFSGAINYAYNQPITGPTIEFCDVSVPPKTPKLCPAAAGGEVYDRKGRFLYYPLSYDNGPDYWEEGLRRYVDNGKVGFADKSGNKILPAKWDFASPFNYGYAVVYEGGWVKHYDSGGEHWWLDAVSKKSVSYLINKKGERVNPLSAGQAKDYKYEGAWYPYPFRYSASEQQIIDSLQRLDVINDIHLVNVYDDAPRKDLLLQFEITERPAPDFPYYTVQGFSRQQREDRIQFIVSPDGKNFRYQPWSDSEAPVPLRQWIVAELKAAKAFMQEHTDTPFRFDADARLKEWEPSN